MLGYATPMPLQMGGGGYVPLAPALDLTPSPRGDGYDARQKNGQSRRGNQRHADALSRSGITQGRSLDADLRTLLREHCPITSIQRRLQEPDKATHAEHARARTTASGTHRRSPQCVPRRSSLIQSPIGAQLSAFFNATPLLSTGFRCPRYAVVAQGRPLRSRRARLGEAACARSAVGDCGGRGRLEAAPSAAPASARRRLTHALCLVGGAGGGTRRARCRAGARATAAGPDASSAASVAVAWVSLGCCRWLSRADGPQKSGRGGQRKWQGLAGNGGRWGRVGGGGVRGKGWVRVGSEGVVCAGVLCVMAAWHPGRWHPPPFVKIVVRCRKHLLYSAEEVSTAQGLSTLGTEVRSV